MNKYKKIYIEITNKCNLNCTFCSKVEKPQRSMTIEEFEIIIKKIKDYTDTIYLHVKGEPLLHKDIDKFLDIASKYGINVNITTNGTLIKNIIEKIKEKSSLKKINFSLHSENNKENYFDDIFNSVEKLNKNVTIVYRLWTLSDGKLDTKSTETVEKIIDFYKLDSEISKKLYTENNVKIKENIYVDKDNEFEWPTITKYQSCGFCYALKTHIAILVDGTVVPCCLDSNGKIELGNIYYQTLDEIINSERYKKLKKSFQDRKPSEELCKSCTYKDRKYKK